ncbi:MAG: hypothetical protein COA71_13180 [SAR86 cluster bacterium]|uniref:DUF3187 family protein n=1 Tax=SAR86 cluster bacterium TaxID=2030880 RepID=A0A2A5C7P1_9GAMM|nr:DUF3187 family protein [Gammaproteobacteria bacterium AH-315-E17]PCJ39832.1 MAG: hypothetical protein COA71_13180 [SAR86 cluster bacterium]
MKTNVLWISISLLFSRANKVSSVKRLIQVLVFLSGSFLCLSCNAQSRTPLQVTNQNPFVRIFGLPTAESAKILQSGQETSHISIDWANNFTQGSNPTESIFIDGESTQLNIRWRYGFDLWEFGVDINYSRYSGGSLDSFIENWHDFFSLDNGGREIAQSNQLRYDYSRDGVQQLSFTENHSGFGDTRLTGAYQLQNESRFDVALRGGIKLPTGKREHFLGSDGVDLNLALVLGDDVSLQQYKASYFITAGVLWTDNGEILSVYRKNTAFYYSTGFIKDITDDWQLKLQLDGHSKLYTSNLPQLGDALQLSIGGSYRLSQDLKLDFAVVEDIITDSSSDVNFHISLYNHF